MLSLYDSQNPTTYHRNEQKRKIEDEIKAELQEISDLRTKATDIARLYQESQKHQLDIEQLESELVATGSVETIEDVQKKLDAATEQLCVCISTIQVSLLTKDSETVKRLKTLCGRPAQSGRSRTGPCKL